MPCDKNPCFLVHSRVPAGRPPTFLAEEVQGSAEFCQELPAFIIHVKINVSSCHDLAGFHALPPRPA